MMEDLIPLLAQTDATLRPTRNWTVRATVQACYEQQTRYERTGFPIKIGGGSYAERKAAERWLDELGKTGLVKFARRNGKRAFWKLSDVADWALRSLCGLPGQPEMLTGLLAIAAHQRAGHVSRQGVIAEPTLLGRENWGNLSKELVALEEVFAPGLCRGLVESASDCYGRTGYCLTPAGRKYLTAPTAPPDELPEYDPDAADVYNAALLDCQHELQHAKPDHASGIVIPLSAGLWTCTAPGGIPSVFTTAGRPRAAKAFLRTPPARTGKRKNGVVRNDKTQRN